MKLDKLSNVELKSLRDMTEQHLNYIGTHVRVTGEFENNHWASLYNKVRAKFDIILDEIMKRIEEIER